MSAPKQQPHFIISLGKSLAQITAEFSPIPGYGLLCAALCSILETCDNVTQNRFASRQLAERCHYFLLAIRESEDKCSLSNPRTAKATAERELVSIRDRMEKWAKMGKFKSYVNQDDIAREIVECHSSLSDCITKLQLTSQFEILEWQKEFSQRSKQDHQVLVEHLADVQAKQEISNDLLRNNNEMLRTLMTMMQTAMGENKQTAERIQHGLSQNLYQLQKTSGQLLPNFNLNSGEVKRTSDFPVRGNATMDIYEGIYLGSERVSMKAIRAMKTDDRTVHRFKREGEIWAKVWERDRGQYIVPFYGFCQIDGPFPYMISPWQENGNTLNYIKANDSKIDYPQFLKRIALGVHLLHTFNPPIVHGDIKSVNILIDDEGNPRLTDFGLSQIIDDVSAAPFTQSSIVADSFRYFAPEVCTGTGVMSTMADIYALGMTVLEANPQNKLSVSTVYAQVLSDEQHGTVLNLTVFGSSPSQIIGLTNSSGSLATLFTTTSILTLNAWRSSEYLCENLRPPSPLPTLATPNTTYCPIAAGPFAFSSRIPWGNDRELTTLHTQLRAVDPFGAELVCVDVDTTPLDPNPHTIYGMANIILWSTVGLAVAYWLLVGLARISAAWKRGLSRSGKGLWPKAQSAGFILASAVSGERLANAPALLRFCTPSLRDVIFHTQWCALLGMVAVQWPQFAYPLLTQTAWSTLVFNVSLTPGARDHLWNPLTNPPFDPPAGFADQIADPQSPIYINPTVPNTLYTLPEGASHGISSFAYTLGIRPQDLFPTCMILFLGIVAGTIVISGVFWFIDVFVTSVLRKFTGNTTYGPTSRNLKGPALGTAAKEVDTPVALLEEDRPLNNPGLGFPLTSISSRNALSISPSDIGSFHGNVLHGNLVRLLILFHLPITVFSCYQMTLPRSVVSAASISLGALSFVIFSLLLPAHLVIRVTFTSTNRLYDDVRTLLSLGPLYNHYRHGSQLFATLLFATNIAFGVTIGVGQKSGTAQAIIILVVEISVGAGPGGWVAYGILIVLALVYLALVLMFLIKLIEATIRIFGRVGFDRSRHVHDAGLFGACGLLGCCGSRRRRRRGKGKGTGKGSSGDKYKSSELGDSPSSLNVGSGFPARRNSDLSSYNPPAALLGADGGSDQGSITNPRFLGSADSRKGSTHSQPPSVLRPEHANQPYREEIDREWWNENEGQGGAFIMGAWQPFGSSGNATGQSGPASKYMSVPQSQQASRPSPSPQATTPSTGFSRVGGGRAHIDSPYAINPTGNNHSQLGLPNSSNTPGHVFPSSGQLSVPPPQNAGSTQPLRSSPVQSHSPSAVVSHPPSSFPRHQVPPANYMDEEEAPLPLSSVRQAQPAPVPMDQLQHHQHAELEPLPPGAMQPAHIRTKSQTAIIEDAGPLLYNPASSSNSASQTGISARFSLSGLQPIKIPSFSSSSGLNPNSASRTQPPPSAPPMFTLSADDDDADDDSGADDQQQKKKCGMSTIPPALLVYLFYHQRT
ncbi:hypothetical protein EST38_g690 [Candolleomyces aberdarensis]|uniref:Protein kinase domain-containing protein n=1 Tax=Candolleomyces aberdarensis TaxID=2316362 RepID=A0A4V1Q5D2_9AGAR|nr:hypothetical protein EST38_g690 [Candolleomyces aberdarensis]